MGLSAKLPAGPVALDTVAFIYYIEEHARFGRIDIADRYEAILTRSRGLKLVDIDRDQLRSAAQLRAARGGERGLRTPDALQLAAALTCRCGAFVTNDRRLPEIRGLPIVRIEDVV